MNNINEPGWHTGYGKIKYDPFRHGMKAKTTWWANLEVDKEITRYYRWWIKNKYWVDLCKPSWDAHASIIRGEEPMQSLQHLWKKYNGQKVQFLYQHNVQNSGDFWYVEVKCPLMTQIRDEFELQSHWNFHITIGRSKQY